MEDLGVPSSFPANPAPCSAEVSPQAWWAAIDAFDALEVERLITAGADLRWGRPSSTSTDPTLHANGDRVGGNALEHLAMVSPPNAHRAVPIVQSLIRAGMDFHDRVTWYGTSFLIAMRAQDPTIARAMIEAYPWASASAPHVHQALMLAIDHHPDLVGVLLAQGVNPNVIPPLRGEPVLARALRLAPLPTVKILLDAGADLSDQARQKTGSVWSLTVRAVRRTGETQKAFEDRRAAVIELLHRQGWLMDRVTQWRVVGEAVAHRCPMPLIHRLIKLGANPHGCTPSQGLSALHLAVDHPDRYGYIEPLLELGLNPMACTASGLTVIDRLRIKAARDPRARSMVVALEARVLRSQLEGAEHPAQGFTQPSTQPPVAPSMEHSMESTPAPSLARVERRRRYRL